jgi:hypothetical protein
MLLHINGKCWSHHFENFTVTTMTWLTVMEYLCHKWPQICFTCRKHFPVLSSFMTYRLLVSSNPLSRKSRKEPQALEYRINWEIYTPYAGAARMLLQINGNFTMGKWKSSLKSAGKSHGKSFQTVIVPVRPVVRATALTGFIRYYIYYRIYSS